MAPPTRWTNRARSTVGVSVAGVSVLVVVADAAVLPANKFPKVRPAAATVSADDGFEALCAFVVGSEALLRLAKASSASLATANSPEVVVVAVVDVVWHIKPTAGRFCRALLRFSSA